MFGERARTLLVGWAEWFGGGGGWCCCFFFVCVLVFSLALSLCYYSRGEE